MEHFIEIGFLVVSLAIILLAAEVFTNGVEWLGKALRLSEGAVGSILAAVGTALPETMIPVMAILFGDEVEGAQIGVGAILGAPFMLSTLALCIAGVAVVINRRKRPSYPRLHINPAVMRRDLGFFLLVYTVAILAAFLNSRPLKLIVALGLVGAYTVYVYLTLKGSGEQGSGGEEDLSLLYLARKSMSPPLHLIVIQILGALALIMVGADLFVGSITYLAEVLKVPSFILALIIAPVATELPEKFNSIIWLNHGKDTLALGNITGAMVFQSSLIPALGIAMTPWELNPTSFISAILALLSSFLVYWQIRTRNYLTVNTLMVGGAFYAFFILLVVFRVIG